MNFIFNLNAFSWKSMQRTASQAAMCFLRICHRHFGCAAPLKGALVALLTGFSLATTTRWWSAMAIGAFYGLAFSLVIYLAKGGPKSGDAPYVIPGGIITGALSGLFIVIWAIKTI